MNMLRALAMASSLAVAVSTNAGAQTDAALGTWNLNLAKSSIEAGAPKSASVRFEQAGKGVKSVQEAVAADGTQTTVSYTADYDGSDYPLTGSASADTVALKFAGGNTVQRMDKKDGKIVTMWSRSISRDGKTMTVSQRGRSGDGKSVDNTWVFDKVAR
jgi:hypothetical protein